MPQRNLAVELLQKLLKGELATRRSRTSCRRGRSPRCWSRRAPLPEPRHRGRAGDRGADRARARHARGPGPRRGAGLTDDELAFYDALEVNDSAVKVLGDDTLRDHRPRAGRHRAPNVTIDWTLRENVRAQLRVIVKRILRKYGYPPDKQERSDADGAGAGIAVGRLSRPREHPPRMLSVPCPSSTSAARAVARPLNCWCAVTRRCARTVAGSTL
jgi:type I restriction enzyme R subunit